MKRKTKSPRSEKDLILETMNTDDDDDDEGGGTMDAFHQTVRGAVQESPTGVDETTIEFGDDTAHESILLDHGGLNQMLDLKRNLEQDFCDSSTDSYWEDETSTREPSSKNESRRWDVTLANSVEVLKSKLRESSDLTSSSARWTGKTIPESPKFHEVKHRRPLPKSTEEQEEEVMKAIKSKPFKARDPPHFEKPNFETKPVPATTPKPFQLHSSTRNRPVQVPKTKEEIDLEECGFRFKARPMPKALQSSPKNSVTTTRPTRIHRPTQTTDEFRSARAKSQVEKVCVEFEVKTMRVEFFMKQDKPNEQRKEHRVTVSDAVSPEKSFQLNCMERHQAFKQRQAEKRLEEEKQIRKKSCFKARPLPASIRRQMLALPAPSAQDAVPQSKKKTTQRVIATKTECAPSTPSTIADVSPRTSQEKDISVDDMDSSDDLEIYFDAEQFSPDILATVDNRTQRVFIRLIKVTSTVMIMTIIILYWKSSSRHEVFAHAKRIVGLTHHDFLHRFDSSSISFIHEIDDNRIEVSRSEEEVIVSEDTLDMAVNEEMYESGDLPAEVEDELVVSSQPLDLNENNDLPIIEPKIREVEFLQLSAENELVMAGSQAETTKAAPRNDTPRETTTEPQETTEKSPLTEKWCNSDVALQLLMDIGDPNTASKLSFDVVEKMNLEKDISVWKVPPFTETHLRIVQEDYGVKKVEASGSQITTAFDSLTPPAAPLLVNRINEPKRNKKAAKRFAPDYFAGLTPEDPESIQRVDAEIIMPIQGQGDFLDTVAVTSVEEDVVVVVVEEDASKRSTEHTGALYFDFLEGFVTADRYLKRMNGRAAAHPSDRKKRTQNRVGSDYHIQRWLDLSVDEMVVLNGIFGIRLDSAFQKDVYRIRP